MSDQKKNNKSCHNKYDKDTCIKCNSGVDIICSNNDPCGAPLLDKLFNVVYLPIDKIKTIIKYVNASELPSVGVDSPALLLSLIGNGIVNFTPFFSLLGDSNFAGSSVPFYDFGNTSFFSKLDDKSCEKKVTVPYFDIIKRFSNKIKNDVAFATAMVSFTIFSRSTIIDSNTGLPVIATELVPKIILDNTGNITNIDQILLNADQLYFKCNNFITVPVSAQLFLFKTTTLPGFESGNFLIAIVITTDYNAISTQYMVIYDLRSNTILMQQGQSSFIVSFMQNSHKNCDKLWVMDYTPPLVGLNINSFENLFIPVATPPVITTAEVTGDGSVLSISGVFQGANENNVIILLTDDNSTNILLPTNVTQFNILSDIQTPIQIPEGTYTLQIQINALVSNSIQITI